MFVDLIDDAINIEYNQSIMKNKPAQMQTMIYKTLVIVLLAIYVSADCTSDYCTSCPGSDSNCVNCDSGYTAQGGRCCSPYCTSCTSGGTSDLGHCGGCINNSYAIRNSDSQCALCSALITNCIQCTSQTACTTCAATYINNGTSCYSCSTSMPGCTACNSSTFCTACANNTIAVSPSTNQCVSCSSLLVGCSNCSTAQICIACLNTSFLLNASTTVCDNCSSLLDFCMACNSTTVCTACLNNSYAVNSSSFKCVICQSLLLGCLRCSSSISCIDCVNNTYVLNSSSHLCVTCSSYMSHCTTCHSTTHCLSCDGSPNIILSNKKCVLCNAVIPNCLNCTSITHCTLCPKYYIVNSTFSCSLCSTVMYGCMDCTAINICTRCSSGQIVANGCSSVPGCISVTQNGQNPICTLCNQTSYLSNAVNGICICLKGHIAGQYCTDIVGCVNVVRNTNGVVCTLCDTSKKFILENKTCICSNYYQISNQTCVQICGDGRLIYLPCDDGNTVSGDGCSSACQIQTSYTCKDGTINHKSSCYYKGMVKLKYLCTYKTDDNKAEIIFTTNPFISNIVKSNLIIYLHTQKNCTLGSSSFVGGNIVLSISYFQNIEGSNANVTIQYDKDYILSPNSMINVQLNQCNKNRLDYDPNPTKSLKYAIIVIIQILSALVLLIWLLGSYSHKMIGVQTLHTFQFIFIPHAFAAHYYPVVTYFSKFCNILNLYQKEFTFQKTINSTTESRLNYSADFIFNNGFVAFAQLIMLVVFTIFFAYERSKRYDNNEENRQKTRKQIVHMNKIAKYKQLIYDFLVFPVFIGFFLNFVLSLMIHSNTNFEKGFSHSFLQILAILFTIFSVSFIYFWQWKQLFMKKQLAEQESIHKQNYVPFYLTNFFILCVLVQLSVTYLIPNPLYFLLGFIFVYTVAIFVYKPYHGCVHNVGLFINGVGVIFNLSWVLSQQYIYLTRAKEQLIAVALIAWMILILVFAILRIIFELKRKREVEQSLKKAQTKMNNYKDYETKMRKAILQQTATNINAYLITSQLNNLRKAEEQQLTSKKQNQIKFKNKQKNHRGQITPLSKKYAPYHKNIEQ